MTKQAEDMKAMTMAIEAAVAGKTPAQIATLLNKANVKTSRDGQWYDSSIARRLVADWPACADHANIWKSRSGRQARAALKKKAKKTAKLAAKVQSADPQTEAPTEAKVVLPKTDAPADQAPPAPLPKPAAFSGTTAVPAELPAPSAEDAARTYVFAAFVPGGTCILVTDTQAACVNALATAPQPGPGWRYEVFPKAELSLRLRSNKVVRIVRAP